MPTLPSVARFIDKKNWNMPSWGAKLKTNPKSNCLEIKISWMENSTTKEKWLLSLKGLTEKVKEKFARKVVAFNGKRSASSCVN